MQQAAWISSGQTTQVGFCFACLVVGACLIVQLRAGLHSDVLVNRQGVWQQAAGPVSAAWLDLLSSIIF